MDFNILGLSERHSGPVAEKFEELFTVSVGVRSCEDGFAVEDR